MIKIINYGIGNIKSFETAFNELNVNIEIASHYNDLKNASKLILPGVGSFDSAMNGINNSGMKEILVEKVINNKLPILAVCVGMQILGLQSTEGSLDGLGWIDGYVKKIGENDNSNKLILPHIGWNTIIPNNKSFLLNGIENLNFYFLHSYYLQLSNKDLIKGYSNYYINFPSIIEFKNIFATQFHPEKSHQNGLKLLKNFIEL